MSRREYTINELVNSASFRRLVKGMGTPDEIEMWNNWIEENDQNRTKAKSAISEIVGFEFKDPDFPDIEKKWSKLYSGAIEKQIEPSTQRKSNEKLLKGVFLTAAVFLVISLVGLGIHHFAGGDDAATHLQQVTRERTITTAEGEQKTLTFSDGSKVVLNSNSTLTYSIGLIQHQTIDVTLEGEAYFDVDSDPLKKQPVFAVTTSDGIIRDIGTKFLVSVQNGQSRIVLEEGFVEVEPIDRQGNNVETEVFSVKKGELVEFSRTNILKRELVNSTFYTSWATGFMQFDQTGIHEFAEFLESRFGVKVQIGDINLTDVTLDGAVYFSSLEGLVRSVSEVIGIPIYHSENRDTLIIGDPNKYK